MRTAFFIVSYGQWWNESEDCWRTRSEDATEYPTREAAQRVFEQRELGKDDARVVPYSVYEVANVRAFAPAEAPPTCPHHAPTEFALTDAKGGCWRCRTRGCSLECMRDQRDALASRLAFTEDVILCMEEGRDAAVAWARTTGASWLASEDPEKKAMGLAWMSAAQGLEDGDYLGGMDATARATIATYAKMKMEEAGLTPEPEDRPS